MVHFCLRIAPRSHIVPSMTETLVSRNWTVDKGRRRSMRVLLSVPVTVSGVDAEGTQFCEETRTLVVNAHGALVGLAIQLKTDQKIELTHKITRETKECRVVHTTSPQGDRFQTGIEFLKPSRTFWRIDFPPEDWIVPED